MMMIIKNQLIALLGWVLTVLVTAALSFLLFNKMGRGGLIPALFLLALLLTLLMILLEKTFWIGTEYHLFPFLLVEALALFMILKSSGNDLNDLFRTPDARGFIFRWFGSVSIFLVLPFLGHWIYLKISTL